MIIPTNLTGLTAQNIVVGGSTAFGAPPPVPLTAIPDGETKAEPVRAAIQIQNEEGFLNGVMFTQAKIALNPVTGVQVFDKTLNSLGVYDRNNEWAQVAMGAPFAAAIQVAYRKYTGSTAIKALFSSNVRDQLYVSAGEALSTVIVGGYVVIRNTPFDGACDGVAVAVQNSASPRAYVYASLPNNNPEIWQKTAGATMTGMTLASSETLGNYDDKSPIVLAFLGGSAGATGLGNAGTDTTLEIFIYYANFFTAV